MSFISAGASANRLQKMGNGVFPIALSNADQGRRLSELAVSKGAKRVAVVSVADCAYCQDLASSFSGRYAAQGFEVRKTVY